MLFYILLMLLLAGFSFHLRKQTLENRCNFTKDFCTNAQKTDSVCRVLLFLYKCALGSAVLMIASLLLYRLAKIRLYQLFAVLSILLYSGGCIRAMWILQKILHPIKENKK